MQMQQSNLKKSATTGPNGFNYNNNNNNGSNFETSQYQQSAQVQQQHHKLDQQMTNSTMSPYNPYSSEFGQMEREPTTADHPSRKMDKYFQPISMNMSTKSSTIMSHANQSKGLKDEDEVDKEVEIIHEQGKHRVRPFFTQKLFIRAPKSELNLN